jgi:hypothetical protein
MGAKPRMNRNVRAALAVAISAGLNGGSSPVTWEEALKGMTCSLANSLYVPNLAART